MKALLDTCTFIWLCAEPHGLSAAAKEILDDTGNSLLLSDVSATEIALRWSAGTLTLPDYHSDPFHRLLIATALTVGATIITPDAAIQSCPVSWRW